MQRLVKPEYDNEYEIVICGDVNDADYVVTTTIITEIQFDTILAALVEFKGLLGQYNTIEFYEGKELLKRKDCLNKFYLLDDYVNIPSCEDRYCHTIESIDIYFRDKETSIRYIVEIFDF